MRPPEAAGAVLGTADSCGRPPARPGGFQLAYSREPSTGSAVVDVALDEVTRTANTGG